MLCGRAAAGTVPLSLWAFHRANECGFLQHAVAAHSASKHGTFDGIFNISHHPACERFFLERVVAWLPAATGGKSRHRGISFLALRGRTAILSPAVEAQVT